MVELGELEDHARQFADRNVRVVVVSDDDLATARMTQSDFPHLLVVSDANHDCARTLEVMQPGAGRDGTDTNAPTTFLIDAHRNVQWFYRPARFITRLSAKDLLKAIDRNQ